MSIKDKERNIIIFVGYGIGDFIWATSIFPLIKSYDKNIKITLLTFYDYAIMIKDLNIVDEYISINHTFFESKNRVIRYIYKIFFVLRNYFKFKKYSEIIFLDDNKFLIKIFNKFYRTKNIYGADLQCCGYNLKNKYIDLFTHIIKMPKDMDRFHCMMKYQYMIRSIFPTYNLAIPILPDDNNLERIIKHKFLQNTRKYKCRNTRFFSQLRHHILKCRY